MAQDRFIYWEDNTKRPSIEELEETLRRYLHCGDEVERQGDITLIATLPGTACHVWRPDLDAVEHEMGGAKNRERWFEIYCNPDSTYDVLTRHADEFTNAIADGFAALVARYWGGTWNREE